MDIAEFLRSSANCCFYQMLLRHDQSKAIFCTVYSFKILVSERKYKNNLKNRESQKHNIFYYSHINKVYVMFYYEIQLFYQDLKTVKFVLSSRCQNAGPVTRDHFKSSQTRSEKSLQL